jgi:hypothetical protein
MTVRELIAKLEAMIAADPSVADVKVSSEGCDCYGDAVDVRDTNDGGDRRILIARGR